MTFHPAYAKNGKFYTIHTEAGHVLETKTPDLPAQDRTVVHGVLTEWTTANPSTSTFSGTRREVLRVAFGGYIHGLQQIDFNPTAKPGDDDYGLLYIAAGDGGGGTFTDDPQNLGIPQGKILRIDPLGINGAGGEYGIPRRTPSWASQVPSQRSTPAGCVQHGYTYPVAAYDHDPPPGWPCDQDSGHAVIGGCVYHGDAMPTLRGKYVFGDGNVIGYLNEDGTATVTGSALPVDEAGVACAHVEELARAAKRAGHPGRIGPLRADIYLIIDDLPEPRPRPGPGDDARRERCVRRAR